MKTALSSHDSRDQSTKEGGREPNPDGAGPSSDEQTQPLQALHALLELRCCFRGLGLTLWP